MCEIVVDPLVIAVTSVVLYGIFEGDDSQHDNEGDHGDLLLKGFHHRNPVQQHQEQEVQVCRSAKTCILWSQSNYTFTQCLLPFYLSYSSSFFHKSCTILYIILASPPQKKPHQNKPTKTTHCELSFCNNFRFELSQICLCKLCAF